MRSCGRKVVGRNELLDESTDAASSARAGERSGDLSYYGIPDSTMGRSFILKQRRPTRPRHRRRLGGPPGRRRRRGRGFFVLRRFERVCAFSSKESVDRSSNGSVTGFPSASTPLRSSIRRSARSSSV